MSEGRRSTLLAYLQHLGSIAEVESSDAYLLERFALGRDEAAFMALMRRHGQMVWGVCRRVLPQEQAAEDAFQATFLVLVRKARSVSKRAPVRSWLYGVALRVALRARQREGLRRRREQSLMLRRTGDPPAEAGWDEVRSLLDEEIQGLPEKYRLPIILCYLEGRTNDEAARQLNCPRGTVAVRLARARERLRSRLIRRGLTLSAMAFTAMLSESASTTAAPRTLISQTANAALTGAASVSITTLTDGAIHAMFVTKLKMALAVALALAVIGTAGLCAYYLRAQEAPNRGEGDLLPATKAKVTDTSSERMQRLLKERRDMAEKEVKVRYEETFLADAPIPRFDALLASLKRLRRAELEMSKKKADRLAAHEKYLKVTKEFAESAKAKFKLGQINLADYARAEYERLEAEIALEREKVGQ
jgi:RNA polymerase sigma factor (sigma-70 family)